MLTYRPDDSFGVYRNTVEIETIDDVQFFTSTCTPRADAVLDAEELGAQDGFDDVLSSEAIRRGLQVRFDSENVMPGATSRLILTSR